MACKVSEFPNINCFPVVDMCIHKQFFAPDYCTLFSFRPVGVKIFRSTFRFDLMRRGPVRQTTKDSSLSQKDDPLQDAAQEEGPVEVNLHRKFEGDEFSPKTVQG
jgi:hypothetical protein